MKKIYYSWFLGYPKPSNQIVNYPWFYELKKGSPMPSDFFSPLTKSLSNYNNNNYEHFRCPAFKEWNKNMWVVNQPFDITFSYDNQSRIINHEAIGDPLKDYFFVHQNKDNIYPEVQFEYQILFWTKEKNVWVELYHHPELYRVNLELIPGTFCISEWNRPINFAFKILKVNENITLKKGMPLYNLKFVSKSNDSEFSLEQKDAPDEIIKKVEKDVFLKEYARNESWSLMKKRINKNKDNCPFLNFFKR